MARLTDEYICVWLDQVRRERNPFDRTQVDFDTWEAMLVELQSRRSSTPQPRQEATVSELDKPLDAAEMALAIDTAREHLRDLHPQFHDDDDTLIARALLTLHGRKSKRRSALSEVERKAIEMTCADIRATRYGVPQGGYTECALAAISKLIAGHGKGRV